MPQITKASSPTPTKLTTSQRELLSSAMARKGRVVIPSATLTGAAADRMAGKLLKLGLVQEIEARGTMPVWRQEGERGLALKLTPAGITAIEAAEIGAEPVVAARTSAPRADSKIARVIERLAAPDGATLADLVTMTGWLPHTTRAALTGLRRRGFTLERESDTNGPSVYRICGTPQAVGPAE